MRRQRVNTVLLLGVLVVPIAACGTSRAGPLSNAVATMEVCGVTALAGGPPTAVGVKNPSLLHTCPSGGVSNAPQFTLVSSTGASYPVDTYTDTGWTAKLPPGTYRPTGMPGCSSPGQTFVVKTGQRVTGVVVWWGCSYS
jgi:hypothetical protein